MEYAQDSRLGSMSGTGNAVLPPRAMDRVSEAADRAGVMADSLSSLVARFRRSESSANAAGMQKDQISVSYLDQITRLHANLDLASKLIDELNEIA